MENTEKAVVAVESTTPTNKGIANRRGRPVTNIVVAVPQRRTSEDRALFGEVEGQEKLDAVAAALAEKVSEAANKQGAKLAGITPHAREYIVARTVWLLNRSIA